MAVRAERPGQVSGASAGRVWLDVPYAEKDDAKALGARWDPAARRWWAPRSGVGGLERWAARPEVPELLPGEDRTFGSGLFVDLVPSSCWFTHVRSCVEPRDWERLRRMIVTRADRRCEACGRGEDRQARRWLEAHERWDYHDRIGVQRLRRLVCLCTDCHTATHFGLATLRGAGEDALTHLCAVAGMSRREARDHVEDAFAVWGRRSRRLWTLNLSILTGAGIAVPAPSEACVRRGVAERRLRAGSGL